MLIEANSYTDVRAAAQAAAPLPEPNPQRMPTRAGRLNILIKKAKAKGYKSLQEWAWAELKEGGRLHEYLRREKFLSPLRQRQVARQMDGFRQNNKSEHELAAVIPAREFFRWKRQDPHFFEDDNNLKSLKRDNPELSPCIFV